jgi:hypothetical protein
MNAELLRVYQWAHDQHLVEMNAYRDSRKSLAARAQHLGRAQAYLMMVQYMVHGQMFDGQGDDFYKIVDY